MLVDANADLRDTVLLTTFYADPDARRCEDFLACLRRNLDNDRLAEIHVFVEDPLEPELLRQTYPVLANSKFRLVGHGGRVTYGELFAYANAELAGRRVAIANADIYFDSGLGRLRGYGLGDTLLCLSRWDVQSDGSARLFAYGDSQDAWIFDAPIRPFACDFHLGLPGCDNRLAWEAARAGLRVANPSRSLRVYHLHLSEIRRYSQEQRMIGWTRDVPVEYLGPAPDLPGASVAFRESMGYEIAELEPGVSSHVNEERPFAAIPGTLHGCSFTQVVAGCAAPVEIEFLSSGKLFVLAGNDWAGVEAARDWLCAVGFHERLPLIETLPGVGFETWSLVGDAGDRLDCPTQVMLVADRLVRGPSG